VSGARAPGPTCNCRSGPSRAGGRALSSPTSPSLSPLPPPDPTTTNHPFKASRQTASTRTVLVTSFETSPNVGLPACCSDADRQPPATGQQRHRLEFASSRRRCRRARQADGRADRGKEEEVAGLADQAVVDSPDPGRRRDRHGQGCASLLPIFQSSPWASPSPSGPSGWSGRTEIRASLWLFGWWPAPARSARRPTRTLLGGVHSSPRSREHDARSGPVTCDRVPSASQPKTAARRAGREQTRALRGSLVRC
jgi:hypothetical protein